MNLKNANVLITGGSLGIGKATAMLLKEHGANIAITGRNKDRLDKAAKEIGAIAIQADAGNEADIKKTFEELSSHWDRLDVLVNNAGIGKHSALAEVTSKEFTDVFNVNVLGAALYAREAAEWFKKQNSGNIINIASTSGLKGYETGTMYVASKFALRGMTECWRAELRRYNVRVTLVNPSEVTTAFGNPQGVERPDEPKKLRSMEIAHVIKSVLEIDDRGFVTDATVFATNPW
ncbi:MAG: short-chain dehydrogenase [Ectothiorhodospiraceae bacterium]|nr:short-chain dehydrogenase [Ectothiorhodospiraceae bacterium]